ncbi:MAG: AAA family ATPase [Treponema sp.]|nr:AAA family ATPase [Treponema sp.]
MGDSYILKISSLSHTFSLIESGVDFSFKYNLIENDQLTNILKVLKVGDTFFCAIGDYIKSYFSIKNIDDKDAILNKIIEVAKGYKIEDINIVKKLEEDLIYKIDDKLKAEILKSMSPNTKEEKPYTPLDYTPCKDKKYKSYNRIIFGAPGTGKSFQLKQESTDGNHFANIERVTFHPDYSYGQFVGSYKPVSDDDGRIRYEYVPGPFMRTLVKALESGKKGESAEKFLLIVEEINRAKVAAVFGDMFQLLDRTDAGDSVYEIQASEDVRRYLARELGGTKENYTSIKIPNNMYIWATMNSADQGVFPMDTAFKRRWEFTYIGINENDDKISIDNLPVKNSEGNEIEWNILRKSINNMLLKECKVNEDKLLGPFFISGEVFKNATSNTDAFFEAFNSKVLMYLFEDAGKMHQKKLFAGIDQNELTFSKVCEDFKTRGTAIFGNSFQLVKE